jgi:hypothetical protein
MIDTPITPSSGSLGFQGHQPRVDVTPPWKGKPWEVAAEAANRGLNGQGYIVHAVMMAGRWGVPLTLTIIILMLVQIGVAILRVIHR